MTGALRLPLLHLLDRHPQLRAQRNQLRLRLLVHCRLGGLQL